MNDCAWHDESGKFVNGCARLKDQVPCYPTLCKWYETAEQRAARYEKAKKLGSVIEGQAVESTTGRKQKK